MATPPPAMKLILATIEDYDAPALLRALAERGWGATQIAATGGALRSGRVTLLIGLPAPQVRPALRLIREYCRQSVEPQTIEADTDETWYPPAPVAALMGGALVLVLPVVRFERFT
jgi:uncharacterized protein YaaQ